MIMPLLALVDLIVRFYYVVTFTYKMKKVKLKNTNVLLLYSFNKKVIL